MYLKRCQFRFDSLLSVILLITAMQTFCTGGAHAGDRPELLETEHDVVGEIPIVLSASRIHQPLTEAPSSMTIIDRDIIEAAGVIEIADIFRLVPGIQVSYPTGNITAVTYHGYTDSWPRAMLVQVDGRAVYKSSYSNVDWLRLGVALEDIDRIEVIRGPNSPLYGSNAVRGVINIITRQPYQDSGTYFRATAGKYDTGYVTLRHADKAGEMDYRLTATYQEADGFPGNISQSNDNRQLNGVNFRGSLQHGANSELDLQLGATGGQLGAGVTGILNDVAHELDVLSHYQFVGWRHTMANKDEFNLRAYHNSDLTDDRFRTLISSGAGIAPADVLSTFGVPDQLIEDGIYQSEDERYDIELEYVLTYGDNVNAVFGVGARKDRWKSDITANTNDWFEENSRRVYTNIQYRMFHRWLLSVGAMHEYTDLENAHTSPRVALNYLISGNHAIRVSYTQAFRNPSLLERNIDYGFNLSDGTRFLDVLQAGDLDAETLVSRELGYVGYWLNQTLQLDLKVFREEYENTIETIKDLSTPQKLSHYQNNGNIAIAGTEVQISFKPTHKNLVSLQYARLYADATVQRAINPTTFREDIDYSIPSHTFSALASRRLPHGFEISAAFYKMTSMIWRGDGDPVPNYHRIDIRLAKGFKLGSNRAKIELIGHNLRDDYQEFREENLFETRGYVRLSMEF